MNSDQQWLFSMGLVGRAHAWHGKSLLAVQISLNQITSSYFICKEKQKVNTWDDYWLRVHRRGHTQSMQETSSKQLNQRTSTWHRKKYPNVYKIKNCIKDKMLNSKNSLKSSGYRQNPSPNSVMVNLESIILPDTPRIRAPRSCHWRQPLALQFPLGMLEAMSQPCHPSQSIPRIGSNILHGGLVNNYRTRARLRDANGAWLVNASTQGPTTTCHQVACCMRAMTSEREKGGQQTRGPSCFPPVCDHRSSFPERG